MLFDLERLSVSANRYAAETALAEAGLPVHMYLDSSDVRRALVGVHAFYTEDGSFRRDEFESHATLAAVLVSSGAAGPIRLLAPHQSELFTLIEFGLNVGPAEEFRQTVGRFRADIEQVYGAEMKQQADDAGSDFLRLDFAIKESAWLHWRARLNEWLERGILDKEAPELRYEDMVYNGEFRRIQSAFDRRRPYRSLNNFADAAALMTLIRLVDRVNRDADDQEVACFYTSSTTFRSVVEELNLHDRLCVKRDGAQFDVLIDTDYVIFRALRSAERDTTSRLVADLGAEDVNPAEPASLTTMHADLSRDVDSVFRHIFYRDIWRRRARTLALYDKALEERVARLRSEGARVENDARLQDLVTNLSRRTTRFRTLRTIWTRLETAIDKLHARAVEGGVNPMFASGLIRFSFPNEEHIRGVVGQLLSKDENAWNKVARDVFRVVTSAEKQPEGALATACAVLWLLEQFDLIVDVLFAERRRMARPNDPVDRPPRPFSHFSLHTVLAAALLRERRYEEAQREYEMLESAFNNARPNSAARVDLAIALAYVAFRLGEANGFKPTWSFDEGESTTEGRNFVKQSVDYASFAANQHVTSRPDKQAYAANQRLFYLVARGEKNVGLKQPLVRLVNFLAEPAVWQSRFEDTIARYYFLLYRRSTDADQRLASLKNAIHHADKAYTGGSIDPEIVAFRIALHAELQSPTMPPPAGEQPAVDLPQDA